MFKALAADVKRRSALTGAEICATWKGDYLKKAYDGKYRLCDLNPDRVNKYEWLPDALKNRSRTAAFDFYNKQSFEQREASISFLAIEHQGDPAAERAEASDLVSTFLRIPNCWLIGN